MWLSLLNGLIPAILTAIILLWGYGRQIDLFKSKLPTSNEIAARSSSVTLILKLEDQFTDLEDERSLVSTRILNSKLLDTILTDYESQVGAECEDIFDFFDTLGFLVNNKYLDAEVAWHYFDHWFQLYYSLLVKYDIKKATPHGVTVWNNLEPLCKKFDELEVKKGGKSRDLLNVELMKKYFSQEITDPV